MSTCKQQVKTWESAGEQPEVWCDRKCVYSGDAQTSSPEYEEIWQEWGMDELHCVCSASPAVFHQYNLNWLDSSCSSGLSGKHHWSLNLCRFCILGRVVFLAVYVWWTVDVVKFSAARATLNLMTMGSCLCSQVWGSYYWLFDKIAAIMLISGWPLTWASCWFRSTHVCAIFLRLLLFHQTIISLLMLEF